ncbi:hypothetical protein Rruber_03399 [Rhodococcus ruber]
MTMEPKGPGSLPSTPEASDDYGVRLEAGQGAAAARNASGADAGGPPEAWERWILLYVTLPGCWSALVLAAFTPPLAPARRAPAGHDLRDHCRDRIRSGPARSLHAARVRRSVSAASEIRLPAGLLHRRRPIPGVDRSVRRPPRHGADSDLCRAHTGRGLREPGGVGSRGSDPGRGFQRDDSVVVTTTGSGWVGPGPGGHAVVPASPTRATGRSTTSTDERAGLP